MREHPDCSMNSFGRSHQKIPFFGDNLETDRWMLSGDNIQNPLVDWYVGVWVLLLIEVNVPLPPRFLITFARSRPETSNPIGKTAPILAGNCTDMMLGLHPLENRKFPSNHPVKTLFT